MNLDNKRPLNGDYFQVGKLKIGKLTLDYVLQTIKFDEYYIFKATHRFRQITLDEFKQFKYACYTFFKKDLYDLNEFTNWIKWLDDSKVKLKFLNKAFPPFNITKKTIIK